MKLKVFESELTGNSVSSHDRPGAVTNCGRKPPKRQCVEKC